MVRVSRRSRGQLVLVAAAVIALALVPMLAAYLQLGYHADVRAASAPPDAGENARRVLDRAVQNASATVAAERFGAGERAAALVRGRTLLDDARRELAASRVAEGVAYRVSYNASAARRWAGSAADGGPGRQFGPYRADDGLVTQSRADQTHLVAAAVDVEVTAARSTTRLTFVVRPYR
jgi:cell division septation protein DedD